MEGMKQAAEFHNLQSYILLFRAEQKDSPLPLNVSSLYNVKPSEGIELFVFGLIDLIDKDIERNAAVPKYVKIMRGVQGDIKGILGKANKKLDSLRQENPPQS